MVPGRMVWSSGLSNPARVLTRPDRSVVNESHWPLIYASLLETLSGKVTMSKFMLFWLSKSWMFSSVVVPCCTQIVAPLSSIMLVTPRLFGIMNPWPSKNMVCAKLPQVASRELVQVVFRDMMSTSPDWMDGPRSAAVVGRNSTASGLPRTAAATARHRSMSNPTVLPPESRKPNPATLLLLAQTRVPRSRTVCNRLVPWLSMVVASVASGAAVAPIASGDGYTAAVGSDVAGLAGSSCPHPTNAMTASRMAAQQKYCTYLPIIR